MTMTTTMTKVVGQEGGRIPNSAVTAFALLSYLNEKIYVIG